VGYYFVSDSVTERSYMKFPLVTILIITWNRKKDVLETVQSVYEQAYPNFEIVVVDNGSNDGTVDAIHHTYPIVRVVPLNRNMGVSVGRNAGIAIAQGEIIFCLDSDASLGCDTLNYLICKFQAEPKIGVINSKIVNAYTKTLDGGPGWVYSSKQKAQEYKEFSSFSFSEGGAAIRKEVFDRVGLFWDFLFFGCEGQEFSLRVLDAGYTILYYPKSIVYHRSSPNARLIAKDRDCNILMNSLSIYFVRYPWWMFILLTPLKVIATFFRGTRRGYLRQVLVTLLGFIRNLPFLWRQRHPIRNETALYYMKLLHEQGPLSWDLFTWLKYKS
jgi:GT2 family glycosyltransferase